MELVLETKELTKRYKNCTGLDRFSIQLERGRIYGLIGNNGAGKSTLFQILAGLLRPSAGSYSLLGAKTERENRLARRKIGFLFVESGLAGGMNAVQNLLALQCLKGYRDPQEARRLLERLGLQPVQTEHEHLSTYSTGQRQRVAVAAALLGQPELLIWDEPLTGLDPEAIELVHEILLEECQKRQVTILLSSHNLPQFYRLATDYIFLHHGKLMQTVDRETLRQRRTYVISVEVPDPETGKRVLQQAYPEQQISVENGRMILEDCTIATAEICTVLNKNNVMVGEITSSGSTLEDYFLSIIGEKT